MSALLTLFLFFIKMSIVKLDRLTCIFVSLAARCERAEYFRGREMGFDGTNWTFFFCSRSFKSSVSGVFL